MVCKNMSGILTTNAKLKRFFEMQVAFVLAEEGSPEEAIALGRRNRALEVLTDNERFYAAAIALGAKNVLQRLRNGLPETDETASEAA